jgi:hypothetical protein
MVAQHKTCIVREYIGDSRYCASGVFRAAVSKRCDTGFPEKEAILSRCCDAEWDEVKHLPTDAGHKFANGSEAVDEVQGVTG